MAWKSRFGNTLTTALVRLVRHGCPPDTQSGFRAHARPCVARIVADVRPGRYETELRILFLALDARARIATVPIPTRYVDRNAASHFRPVADGLRVYRALARGLLPARARHAKGQDPAPR